MGSEALPATARILERAVVPLDAARSRVLRAIVRAPALRRVLARRDARLMVHALASVSVAAALTCLGPGVLFVVGPALFGVAHVAADARYLVLRRAPGDLWRWTLGAGCVALFALRALEMALPDHAPFAAIEVAVGWSLALAGIAVALASSRSGPARRRALLAAPLLLALGAAAVTHAHLARLLFAHVHNVVAIALWLWLFRARRRFALPALALLAVFAALLLSGAALPLVRLDGPGAARLVQESVFAWPGWMPQRTALALGLLYVLLQSVHYTVWLAFIPQDDVRAQGTLSFRMSVRGLIRDFTVPGLAAIAVLAVAVLGASALDAHRTRQLYLSLATFHGYLELGAGAFLWVRGR
jgi:hypothetical protein